MKILLLGAGGQLAHDLKKSLQRHEVISWTRQDLDIEDEQTVGEKIRRLRPGLTINAAAYNLVDLAESEPIQAYKTNALGPRNLAKTCGELDCALLHFSTDYVFGLESPLETGVDWESAPGWTESDAPGPVSVYGATKLAGEYAVRTHCPKHYVLRTCGLYGVKGSRGKGGNFVETMLRLAGQGKPLRVVDDQYCTPSYTRDVAEATAALIETERYGLYHVANSGRCTWYRLATEAFRLQGLTVDCQPISSAEFAAAARRPPFSVLDGTKLESAGVGKLADWRDALERYLRERGA